MVKSSVKQTTIPTNSQIKVKVSIRPSWAINLSELLILLLTTSRQSLFTENKTWSFCWHLNLIAPYFLLIFTFIFYIYDDFYSTYH
jgi:hypothetical protein